MVANESWVNLEEVMDWAENHQQEVAKIVDNATAFATRYLSAQGRCVAAALVTLSEHSTFTQQLPHDEESLVNLHRPERSRSRLFRL